MSRLTLKRDVVGLLQHAELPVIFKNLQRYSGRELINPLFSCLCHAEEIVRWHTVSVFGFIVPVMATNNIEDARIVMRRFLWMLNDESGGIGWGIPEAMAEVMYHHDGLAEEYTHMLVSYTLDDGPELYQDGNFLEMPMLQQGLLWGLCRMAEKQETILMRKGIESNLGCYFSSPDSQVRGLVCRLCDRLGLTRFAEMIAGLVHDDQHVRIYQEGRFMDCCVADLAKKAIERLESAEWRTRQQRE